MDIEDMKKKDLNIKTLRNDYLSIYVNSFVIQTEKHSVFIDTGLHSGINQFEEQIQKDKDLIVLSTHGHWDHIGLHSYMHERGAVIYGHEGDERFYRDHHWHWKVLFEQFAKDYKLPKARKDVFHIEIGDEVEIDRLINSGELIEIDDLSFQVIHTPGHSDGSVCFYEKRTGSLFTGDTLMGDGFFTGIPQYSDYTSYLSSIESLSRLNVSQVFSDHNPVLKGKSLIREVQQSLDCAERIEKTVREFVQSGRNISEIKLGEVAAFICETEGKAIGAGACVTALAHLELLKEEYKTVNDCVAKYT